MKKIFGALLIFILISQTGFSQDNYKLIWSDEFENSGTLSPENWEYELGSHGWGNNELQNYTDSQENSFIRDGKLIIRAIKKADKWTSARLVTRNKVDFLYGKMTVRAKLPSGKGTWPAIWMLPTDWEYGDWPSSGEIDIMEHVGYNPGVIHATVHTKSYNHVIGTQVGQSTTLPDFADAFHDYTVIWTPDRIEVFLDENKYFTFTNDLAGNPDTWPFDKRFHLILNIAVGGNWGGAEGIDPELTNATMEIDYVRLYRMN